MSYVICTYEKHHKHLGTISMYNPCLKKYAICGTLFGLLYYGLPTMHKDPQLRFNRKTRPTSVME